MQFYIDRLYRRCFIKDGEHGRHPDRLVEMQRRRLPLGGILLELFPTDQQTGQQETLQVSTTRYQKAKLPNYFLPLSFRIQYLDIEEAIKRSPEEYKEVAEKTSGVKLQLVVVCPSFLEFISENPEESGSFGKLLLADRTLALLLGVGDADLNDVHKKGNSIKFEVG